MLENASVCKLFETLNNVCLYHAKFLLLVFFYYLPFMHIIAFNIILPKFRTRLILKAQSDKTPVINLLVFK